MNVWKSIHKFRGDAAISTWIYRIAVNTSLGFSGKAFRNLKMTVDAEKEDLSLILDEGYDDKLKLENQIEALHIELNQLSVIDKSLMSLLLEGLTMREIAEIIGLTEPNVKVKIHRIKSNLKEKLEYVLEEE